MVERDDGDSAAAQVGKQNGKEEGNVPHNNSEDCSFSGQFEDDWTSSELSSSNDEESDEEAIWGKSKRKKRGKKSSANKMRNDETISHPTFPIFRGSGPPIQKILGYKELTPLQWSKKMMKMNTRFISHGSMFHAEKTGHKRKRKDGENVSNNDGDDAAMQRSTNFDGKVGRYLIRWSNLSYLHITWELRHDIERYVGKNGVKYLCRFDRKNNISELGGETSPGKEYWDGVFFSPDCVEIDRILDIVHNTDGETLLLVKWLGCGYSELTYESLSDLTQCGIDSRSAEDAYIERENIRARKTLLQAAKGGVFCYPTVAPDFKNKGKLRDHQLVGVKWILANWAADRSCILADEMGLGKTLQCLTAVWWLLTKAGQSGPCLIVAPLSTLQHWKRESEEWIGLNTVVYHGSKADRDVIIQYEMQFSQSKGKSVVSNGETLHKPQVIITTPATVIEHGYPLKDFHFSMLVVDEAQRLKNANAALNKILTEELDWESCILLTGTPIQNNIEELWVLLNFVDPHGFDDREWFVDTYGDMTSTEQVAELSAAIKPYLLRRMKEDVEKSVPPKQETIVEVELTSVQKQYYRALYEQNTDFLLQGGIRSGPSLMNLAMELRKCCNHPYLIKGAEKAIHASDVVQGSDTDKLVMTSGKLVLLDKLLPHLKKQGHRVLLFSQFVMLLDILDDYLRGRNYHFGRIDGSITGRDRQSVIDRFQAPGSDLFIMLLSTRAGGQGINLTAADTVIIYDSDWNPQNDIQAQARCHRIGQTNNVKVYRLLTNKTYEQVMFQTASRKLGLDQAILQHQQRKSNSLPQLSSKEVMKLLKHGAYDVFRDSENDNRNEAVFREESITSILNRSETKTYGGGGGTNENGTSGSNEFSKASFISKEGETVGVDDPEFWVKVVGLKVPEKKAPGNGGGKRAARAAVDYNEQAQHGGKALDSHSHNSDDESIRSSDLSSEGSEDSDIERGPNGIVDDWSYGELDALLKQMLLLGYERTSALTATLSSKREPEEIRAVCMAVVSYMFIELVSEMHRAAACRLAEERKLARLNASGAVGKMQVCFPSDAKNEEVGNDTATTTTSVVVEGGSGSSSQPLEARQTSSNADMVRAANELGANECSILQKGVAKQCLNKHEVCRQALRVAKVGSDPVLIAKMIWKPRRLSHVLCSLRGIDGKLSRLDDLLEICRVSEFNLESLHALMLRDPCKPFPWWGSHHDKWLLNRVVTCGWPASNTVFKKILLVGWPAECEGTPDVSVCTLSILRVRLKAIVGMARKVRKLMNTATECKNSINKGPKRSMQGGEMLNGYVQQKPAAYQQQPPTSHQHTNPDIAFDNTTANRVSLLKNMGQKMHVSSQRRAEEVVKQAALSRTITPAAIAALSWSAPYDVEDIKRVCCAIQLLGAPSPLLQHEMESEWFPPYCLVLRGVDIECDHLFIQQLELSWKRFAEFSGLENEHTARTIATALITRKSATSKNVPLYSQSLTPRAMPEKSWLPEIGIMDDTMLKRAITTSRLRQVLCFLGTFGAVVKLCWQLSFIPCISNFTLPYWWNKGYHDAKLLFASVVVGYSPDNTNIYPLFQYSDYPDGRSIIDGSGLSAEEISSTELKARLDAIRAGVIYWAKAPDSFYGKAHTKAISKAVGGSKKLFL